MPLKKAKTDRRIHSPLILKPAFYTMKTIKTEFTFFAALAFVSLINSVLHATPFLTIDTVFVGDAGNAAANSSNASSWGSNYGYGAVAYDYRIGTYEVTISQYTTFLNAVATVPAGAYQTDLWNSNMQTNLRIAGISRTGSGTGGDPYSYAVLGSGDRPITYVSWFDAARFTNWLHNGATLEASTETGAYNLNMATSGIITKEAGASWWLPSSDEWAKAAYYDPTLNSGTGGYTLHANQSNSMTTNTIGAAGGANYRDGDFATTQSNSYLSNQNYLTDVGAYGDTESFYGTFDQGGNVLEWNDATFGVSHLLLTSAMKRLGKAYG